MPQSYETNVIWEGGGLIKRLVSIKKFLKDLRYWVRKAIPHNHIRKIQGEKITTLLHLLKINCAHDAF